MATGGDARATAHRLVVSTFLRRKPMTKTSTAKRTTTKTSVNPDAALLIMIEQCA